MDNKSNEQNTQALQYIAARESRKMLIQNLWIKSSSGAITPPINSKGN